MRATALSPAIYLDNIMALMEAMLNTKLTIICVFSTLFSLTAS
jgi:hypothetical protein